MKGYNCLLVKTAPEITLKSRNVRKYFNDKLVKNIKGLLRAEKLSGTRIDRGEGRLYIYAPAPRLEKIAKNLQCTFGVYAIASALFAQASGIEDVSAKVADEASRVLSRTKTFAVRASFPSEKKFRSKDVEVEAGSAILAKIPGLKVNLSFPEKTMFVEGRKGKIFIYSETMEGPSGLPVGCQGNVAVMVDGSSASLQAAWLMLKRGCSVFPVMKSGTKKSDEKKIEKSLEKLVQWNAGRKFKVTPMENMNLLIEKPDISVKAFVISETSFSESLETEKSAMNLPIYAPLLFIDPKIAGNAEGAVR